MTSQMIHPISRRQRGGTLLGFVLGMLFGLAVALGVAVYITKVPLPFMNKAQPRPAGEAADPKKDWDPNAGLPGRQPPKPEPSPTEPAPAAQPPAPAVNATPPSSKAGDPLGELARSRSEPQTPAAPAVSGSPPAAGADPFQYFVQAGAFRTPEDAEQQRAKLSLMGLQARVSERDQAGRTIYRVRLGPYDKREEADQTRERLGSNGTEAVVVRVQR